MELSGWLARSRRLHQARPTVASLARGMLLSMLLARTCHPLSSVSQTGGKLRKILPCALKGK